MIDPTIAASVRDLERSIRSVAFQLLSALNNDGDMVATVAWVKAEMERLAEESEVIATRLLEIEQRPS